ncbi:hypothetical protein [Paludibacterium yongneupense]|uniref:hypothetical protein n=1 Tax=Paludibacterium yongneupense TaxID=400061 RepID=UPI0004155E37|nr:hypothetical protein [Paludibacterium yongneupense]
MSNRVLRVSAKAEGYRREGLKFSIKPANIPLSLLTSAQIAHLKSDRMLDCEEVDEVHDLVIAPEELADLRDKAATADAVLALLPADWDGSAADYVVQLQSAASESRQTEAPAPAAAKADTGHRRGR